tara:strand:+ start:45 stop:536 length:492 start_codon:yes stop_codon:yes gene_type:complete
MNYSKFEDRISSWIENDLSLKERKEFEAFLAENPQYQSKVDEVRHAISTMRESESLKVSKEFDENLNQKLQNLNIGQEHSTSKEIFGFSRQNFAYLALSLGAIVFLLFQLPGNAFSEDIITNSNSMSEENSKSIPVANDSLDTEDKPDNSYDVNGTFVGNDEQ